MHSWLICVGPTPGLLPPERLWLLANNKERLNREANKRQGRIHSSTTSFSKSGRSLARLTEIVKLRAGRLTWVAPAGILRSEQGKVRMVTGGLIMDESMDTPVDKAQLIEWITASRARR